MNWDDGKRIPAPSLQAQTAFAGLRKSSPRLIDGDRRERIRTLRLPGDKGGGSAMRMAAICDIHGNLPALKAVLQEIRQAEVDQTCLKKR